MFVGAGRDGRDARAGVRHLRRGGELEVAVLVARLAARRADVEQLVLVGRVIVEMVHAVGVVPENAEVVGRALHGGQAAHHVVGVGHAAGVRVLRHAPDALHGGVAGHEALHLVHVGAVRRHGHGDHLDAEGLGDAEVAVVARSGAEPLDAIVLAPRLGAERAEVEAAGHGLVHERKAGVAAHDDVRRVLLHHARHEALRLGQAVQHAVVAAVRAVLGAAVLGRRHRGQHGHALGRAGRRRACRVPC